MTSLYYAALQHMLNGSKQTNKSMNQEHEQVI